MELVFYFLHASSYIILHIPGAIGKMTEATLGKRIDQAFQALNEGIKKEAEWSPIV